MAVLTDEQRRAAWAEMMRLGGASIIVPQYVAASTAPVLSLPGVQDITATSARPKVTLTYA